MIAKIQELLEEVEKLQASNLEEVEALPKQLVMLAVTTKLMLKQSITKVSSQLFSQYLGCQRCV